MNLTAYINILICIMLSFNIYCAGSFFSSKELSWDSSKRIITEKDTALINKYLNIAESLKLDYPDSALYYFKKAENIIKIIIDSKLNIDKKLLDQKLADILFYSGAVYRDVGEFDNAIDYIERAVLLDSLAGNQNASGSKYNSLGLTYISKGDYFFSEHLLDRAFDLAKSNNDLELMVSVNMNYGISFYRRGDYIKAIEYYQKSLDQAIILSDSVSITKCYNNIGSVYYNIQKLDNAFEYFNKALEMSKKLGNKKDVATFYNNLAIIYKNRKDYQKAIEYYNESLKIAHSINDQDGIALSYLNLGNLYLAMEEYDNCYNSYNQAYDIWFDIDNKTGIVYAITALSYLYSDKGDYEIAIKYAKKSIKLSEQIGNLANQIESMWVLASSLEATGNYKESIEAYKKHYSLQDSLNAGEVSKKIAEIEAKHLSEKKQLEIDNLKKDQKLKDLELDRKDNMLTMSITGITLVSFLAVLLFFQFRQKKKANYYLNLKNEEIKQKNEEILAQRDEIEAQRDLAAQQRDLIAEQKKGITDSIHYAFKIQSAILPNPDEVKLFLKEHFILYKPRDIVSGDFYWVNKLNNKIIIIAADCTGHGVPGAFMSMLGVAYLNEIVNKEHITKPARILDRLRENVILALKQRGDDIEQKDGMDVAAITIDPENQKLEFAGANNPLYLIRNNELEEMKGDKMPVSIHIKMCPFSLMEQKIQKGDSIYIFSDGYADQFGGPEGKKFKYNNFKELLRKHNKKSMAEQKKILNETFESWKGDYNQIDDVLVVGIRV